MKTVSFLMIISLSTTILSCNPFKSDHPQASIPNEYDTGLTSKSILTYADSVDQHLANLTKNASLVYVSGEQSFYVERFKNADKIILLIEHTFSGGSNTSLKKYYFKNDSLVLQKTSAESANENGKSYKDSRTFLRSNTIFKTESRTATTSSSLNALPFIDGPVSQHSPADQTLISDALALNDVVDGKDKFEMVFENITTYPDSRYIVLRGKIQKNYISSILVPERDQYIDSLLNTPYTFKDKNLNLKWKIEENEAVYVASNPL